MYTSAVYYSGGFSMESSIVVIDLQKPAEDSAGFCYTNFMFVIIDYL